MMLSGVRRLGRAVMDGFDMGGVMPVVKHMPGHGRATVDSHDELPRIDSDSDTLRQSDFEPFKQLNDALLGMTGHLLFTAIDEGAASTCSKTVIGDIIRNHIGFDGVLMSDDISMSALAGDMGARVTGALKAGCDMVLHCNGDMAEMQAVAEILPSKPQSMPRRALHGLMKRLQVWSQMCRKARAKSGEKSWLIFSRNRRTRYKALWKKTRLIPRKMMALKKALPINRRPKTVWPFIWRAMTGRCMFCWHWRERRKRSQTNFNFDIG